MKILVLGGTGAMGIDLVNILAQRSDEVTVTSRSLRNSEWDNVRYVQGNAHDTEFIKGLMRESFDAIVDFMVYGTEEFRTRRDLMLGMTEQYLFLSSSRVYAESQTPITEDSPRLLDVIKDEKYLKTDEYALAKARQEDLLRQSGKLNWTIIRPYITYSNQRLQLGVYEKELWLYRALHGKTIVFPRPIAERETTLTLGADVALGISKLIGNGKALGHAFHITCGEAIRWNEVLAIYRNTFSTVMGYNIKVKYADDSKPIYDVMGNKYQVIYDRMFDRKFDNTKFFETAGEIEFTAPTNGLKQCLIDFLASPRFRSIPNLAVMDKLAGEKTNLSEIPGEKSKLNYVVVRYLPRKVVSGLRRVKSTALKSGRVEAGRN